MSIDKLKTEQDSLSLSLAENEKKRITLATELLFKIRLERLTGYIDGNNQLIIDKLFSNVCELLEVPLTYDVYYITEIIINKSEKFFPENLQYDAV